MSRLTQTQFTSPRYEDSFLLWSSFSSVLGASHSRMFVRCMVRCLCCILLPFLLPLYSILSRLPLPWPDSETVPEKNSHSSALRAHTCHAQRWPTPTSMYPTASSRSRLSWMGDIPWKLSEFQPTKLAESDGAYICSGKGPRPPHDNA